MTSSGNCRQRKTGMRTDAWKATLPIRTLVNVGISRDKILVYLGSCFRGCCNRANRVSSLYATLVVMHSDIGALANRVVSSMRPREAPMDNNLRPLGLDKAEEDEHLAI